MPTSVGILNIYEHDKILCSVEFEPDFFITSGPENLS